MLLRERFDAGQALELGLLTELVEEGKALSRALELAERIAALPPLAVSVAKQAADLLAESSRETGVGSSASRTGCWRRPTRLATPPRRSRDARAAQA